MAISFIGGAEAGVNNGGDPSLTLPAMQQNDLVIVVGAICDSDGVDFTMAMVTSGYTLATGTDLFSNDTSDTHLAVFYKFMGATPDSTAVFDGQGGTNAACAAIAMVFRGVDTTTPLDVNPATATGLSSFSPDPPSLNHNNPSGVWTVIAGCSGHGLGATGTYTFPTGYTTNARDIGANDTNDVTVGMGYNTAPSDPEDPGVMTHSGTDNANYSWCAATLALRPGATDEVLSAGAPVATVTASATLLAEIALAAGAPVVVVSAPAAVLSTGDQTLVATAPVVTASAPAAVLLAEIALVAGTGLVTVSAPPLTLLAEAALVAGAPVVLVTAPAATLVFDQFLDLVAPVVVISAPSSNLYEDGGGVAYSAVTGVHLHAQYGPPQDVLSAGRSDTAVRQNYQLAHFLNRRR